MPGLIPGGRVKTDVIELPHCTLQLVPEGYITCDQRRDVPQTEETVELLLDELQHLSPEGPACLLVRMNGQPTSKAARARLARATQLRAVAVVLTSTVGSVLVNFFLRVNRPPYPFRIFSTEGAAEEWLLTQVEHRPARPRAARTG